MPTIANSNAATKAEIRALFPISPMGGVLLRFLDTGTWTSGNGGSGQIAQTITAAASGASTPYNYLKWGELVYDDLGDTLAIYPATYTDSIIVPVGARLAKPAFSFALNASSPATTVVTGAANNGSGAIRLAVTSTSGFATGNSITVAAVVGTTEANASWSVDVIDATHFDLKGSTFTNAYISGGTVTGSVGTYRGLRIVTGVTATTNVGGIKLFSFHPTQSNNMANSAAWLPVTAGHRMRIGLLQDTAADWVNPVGDFPSSYFGVEFSR